MATQHNRRGRFLATALCVYGLVTLSAPQHCAAAEPPLEYQVKAAFLLNFTKFVEWPPSAFADSASPFTICVLGKDPFGRALDDLIQGESFNNRKLAIQRISDIPAPQTCQLLFWDVMGKDVHTVLNSLGPGVLTVGDGETFLRDGGMIAFVIENRRVRFDINQSGANAAGLKLSSKLLSVARSVRNETSR